MARKYRVGQTVVYAKQKVSTSPGRRAADVSPAAKGDTYSYMVDKYWVVTRILPDGDLCLTTRRGKEHIISTDDPNLRPMSWLERCGQVWQRLLRT